MRLLASMLLSVLLLTAPTVVQADGTYIDCPAQQLEFEISVRAAPSGWHDFKSGRLQPFWYSEVKEPRGLFCHYGDGKNAPTIGTIAREFPEGMQCTKNTSNPRRFDCLPVIKAQGRVKLPPGTALPPPLSICDAARAARARNSPAAPGLEAQCRAAGGG